MDFEGKSDSHSYDSFNQLNGNSMLPVTPMASVTTQLIGTAKSGNQLILSFPQRHPSLPRVDLVFLQHPDIPPDPPKVFNQIDTPHPRSSCHGIQWMFYLCKIMQC